MPSIYKILGYLIYFWTNENGELIHVHISRGRQSANATKVWITRMGGVVLCHNRSRILDVELNKLLHIISNDSERIVKEWIKRFGYESYYC